MDPLTSLRRLGSQLRDMRVRRGLTQVMVANLAAVPRLKVIQIEAGSPTVSVSAYASVAAALGAELNAMPARRPTLDELSESM
jgi:DNA-binding XRE family transcriptional regulator